MKSFVVPDSSDRWTIVIVLSGSVTPGLRLAIAGSFHFFTLPRNMSATVAPSSFSPFSRPDTLYATVTAPKTVGTICGSPFFLAAAISSGFSGGSEAPKSTVPAVNWATPPPEPIGL